MNFVKDILFSIRRKFLAKLGPKRYCIVCDKHFRGAFKPLDPFYLENSRRTQYPYVFEDAETLNYTEYSCPFCSCSDRDRLYALYLSDNINTNTINRLLDIAPSQPLGKFLKSNPKIQYRSADLMMEDVDDKVDLMNLHIYPENSFDNFICSHVLEHVNDDRKAMSELRRILKPGGFGIAMVPIILPLKEIDEDISITDADERWRRFGQDDHVRLYSKSGFKARLSEAGFKVKEITVQNYNVDQFNLLGISPKSVLYIVSK